MISCFGGHVISRLGSAFSSGHVRRLWRLIKMALELLYNPHIKKKVQLVPIDRQYFIGCHLANGVHQEMTFDVADSTNEWQVGGTSLQAFGLSHHCLSSISLCPVVGRFTHTDRLLELFRFIILTHLGD